MASISKTKIPFKRDTSRSGLTPTDFRTKIYQPYINHAACLEHRSWWREPTIVWGAIVAFSLATVSLSCVFVFASSLESKPDEQIHSTWLLNLFDRRSVQDEKVFWGLCHSGEGLIRRGNTSKGLEIVRQAEAMLNIKDQVRAAMFNDIAIALHSVGQRAESISYLKKAIQADPHLLVAHNNLAMIMIDLGEMDKAAQVLKDASKQHPSNSGIANKLSRLRGKI